MTKHLIHYPLGDGTAIYVEAETLDSDSQRISRDEEIVEADENFKTALSRLKPAAELVLNSLKELNRPDEISLEMGVKFSAKAGIVLASANSEAVFKVTLNWKNE